MKRVITFIVLSSSLCFTSCYDDSAILEKLDDHENRIARLEELCDEMNTNISSLQAIVDVLQNNEYITDVLPVERGGEIIGYTISFSKSQSITIYHGEEGEDGKDGDDGDDGQDGSDGSTPVIGVKMGSDGRYYWILNGEWMYDDDGNMIPATGATGEEGITPVLKIQDGCWFISYDNGVSWKDLGAAAAETYAPDSMFRDVEFDAEYMYLTIKDGTKLTIPIEQEFLLTLESNSLTCLSNKTYTVPYSITGAGDDVQLTTISEGGYATYINEFDKTSGEIVIEMTERAVPGKVVVLANCGPRTVIQTISISYWELSVVPSAYSATYAEYDVLMDKDFKYLYYYPLIMNESTSDGVFHPAQDYIEGTDEDRAELLALLQTRGWTMFVNRNCGKERLKGKHSEFNLQPDTDYVLAYCAVTADGEVSELCFSDTFHTKEQTWVSRNSSDIELNVTKIENDIDYTVKLHFTYNPSETAAVRYVLGSMYRGVFEYFPGSYAFQDDLRDWFDSLEHFEMFGREDVGRYSCEYSGFYVGDEIVIVYYSEDMNGNLGEIMVQTVRMIDDDHIHID